MSALIYVNCFILGFCGGIGVVGIFAPWLVADTHDRLQEELSKLEDSTHKKS